MQSKISSRRTSVLAVAMVVMGATALDAGMSATDAEQQFAAIDRAIASGLNGGRRLQGGWCNVVSDSETYCCGFGARASCLSRGLPYSGPNTPCEVRLVSDGDGVSCVGLEGTSGNLDEEIDCNCEDLSTDPPATDAPSPTPVPSAEVAATPAPLEEGTTAAPVEVAATPAPLEEGTTAAPVEVAASPAPLVEGTTTPPVQTPTPVQTPAPVDTPVPVVQPGDTPAPSAGTRGGSFTMAPLAPGETMAPAADMTPAPLAPGETMAPAADMTPAPLAPGETMAPAADMTTAPLAPGETMAPAADMTLAPLAPGETMAPGATEAPIAPGMTMAPGATEAPLAPGVTMAPGATEAPIDAATPAPTAGSRDFAFTMAPTDSMVATMAPSGAPTMMSAAPTVAPTAFTGAPSVAPTMVPTSMPTPGSRGFDFSAAPSSAPTLSLTLPPDVTLPPSVVRSGSASLSSSNIVAFTATVGGLFAAYAVARN